MKKILIISPDVIGNQMAGPGIRYWHFSMELSKNYEVTLVTPNQCELRNSNFTIVKYSRRLLKNIVNKFDVVLLQGVTLFKNSFLKRSNASLIIDLYDPFIFEMLEVRKNPYDYKMDLQILLEQIRNGDYFICASEKQKDFWIGMLSALNRINLKDYQTDKLANKLIGVVPFGISNEPPINQFNPYTNKKFNFNENDKVILWGGGIWNWLDPITLLHAMSLLVKERQDVKLVFMGTKHPNKLINSEVSISDDVILLSEKLGLKDKYVFFNDWVPYEERQNFYLNAYIGVSAHFNTLETRFSFRTRVLDYIWCGLPMVLSEGDLVSEIIKNNNCGLVVTQGDSVKLKETLLALLSDETEYQNFKINIDKLKKHLLWETVVADLDHFCSIATKREVKFYEMIVEWFREKFLFAEFIAIKSRIIFNKNGFKKIYQYIRGY